VILKASFIFVLKGRNNVEMDLNKKAATILSSSRDMLSDEFPCYNFTITSLNINEVKSVGQV
jgi:hypothetical protein